MCYKRITSVFLSSQQVLYWEMYKRGPDRHRTNWRGVIKNDLLEMTLSWKEAQSTGLDKQNWGG